MGLSTVSQNLTLLEQDGLIKRSGFFESTGGRKANAIQVVSDFKISIGIGILKNMFHITAVDSANSLEQAADMPIKEFFPLLREKKSPQLTQIWEDYLNHLAFAMRNLNLIIDAPIIISGYLAPYFTDDDITYLAERINATAPFALCKDQIFVGTNGQYTPAIGAALYYVKQFIQSV